MGKLGRWATIAAVIGALAILIVVLYLLLEPLHHDNDDSAGAALIVGYTALVNAAPSHGSLS